MRQRLLPIAVGVLLLSCGTLRAQNDFTDHFDRPDGPVDGWTLFRGSWDLTGGQLRTAVAEGWLWAGDPPITLDGDFGLSMNVEFPFVPADAVGRHGGIMFFAGSASERTGNTGYTLDWIDRASDHGFRLIRWSGGAEILVNGTPGVAEPPTLWEVTVVGDRIIVKGDGDFLIDIVDNTYRQGHFAVWSYSNSEILFDNIEIFSGSPGIRACFEATPRTGDAPLEVDFDASCSAGSDEEGIASYDWNFGDGSVAIGDLVSHTFETPDPYTVTLTVTGTGGTTASTSRTIDVFEVDDTPPLDVDRLLSARVKRYGAHADSTVVFNEVMYHPKTNEDALEWFELYNQMAVDMDVSNWLIGDGVSYEIPRGTVIPGGGFLVIARNPPALETETGFADALGPFTRRLDNNGEGLRLFNRSGREMDGFRYGDGGDWPAAPDGSGVSLAKLDPLSASGPAENWAPSAQMGGTPGMPNFPTSGSGSPRLPGLVSYWSFEEAGGSAFDLVGGNTGIVGSGSVRTAGIVGSGALDFDNTVNAFVNVGPGEGNNLSVTDGLTIEALVKVSWSGAVSDADMVFRKEDGTSRLILGLQNDGNDDGRSFPPLAPGYTGPVLAFGVNVGGTYSELELPLDGQAGRPSVGALRDGNPHHIAGTYDAASGVKSIFLDGVRVANVLFDPGSKVSSGGAASAYIGNMSGRGQPFTGLIDEVAIWSRALSAEDIAAHHAGALAGRDYFEGEVSTPEVSTLAFNEFEVATASDYSIEIVNYGNLAVQLEGHRIAPGNLSEFRFANSVLEPNEYLVLSQDDLGFDLASDGKLFLYSANGQSVVDAVKLSTGHRGRHPDGVGRWLVPDAVTPGAANRFTFEDSIVINEIHYHPRLEPATSDVFLETTLVALDSEWKYDVSGQNLGTAWRGPEFNDGGWPSGNAVFFHETADLPGPKNTEIDLGPITYYFRKSFELEDALEGDLQVRLLVDDGAVVYLNGAEVFRFNMPGGSITASTLATPSVGNATITGPYTLSVDNLRLGTNVVAVEVHQSSAGSSDVVFAAEMFASVLVKAGHPSGEPPESWIELYNRGNQTIDLTGWEIDRGIDYAFEAGTLLQAGEYLVIAEDADRLRERHPGVRIVGDFTDRLSNRSDLIVLRDDRGNPVDSVEYFDAGRWPRWADGGGSSLELRDPHADNSKGEAWAASDETGKTEWRMYSYREVAVANVGPTQWREFVIGLLDAGEVLIDDLSVVQSPDSGPLQLLQNGDFESGADAWRVLGNHRHSAVIDDPDGPNNKVLHIIATGPTEHMHNHLETTLVGNTFAPNGVEYEVSFRARWLGGSNQFNTRLYFNRIPQTTLIDVPDLGGSPGTENSTFQENIGPTFDGLRHAPVVPDSGESVSVFIFVEDPDDVRRVTLWWSVAGGAWQSAPMAHEPDTEALYVGRIPGQSSSRIVQFYVEAEDDLGAVSTFPAGGRDARALYKVQDGQSRPGPIHNFRIIMTTGDANFLHAETNVMSNERLGATVVYREEEVFYDVGCRLKGSQRARLGGSRVSFSVQFHPDALFRGAHRTVALDRAGGWGIGAGPTGQDEIIVKHAINQASLPGMYDDIGWLIAPRSGQNGPTLVMMAKYSNVFRRTQYPGDSEGTIYKVELIYYPTTTVNGDPEGLKRPQPDVVIGTDLRDLGDDKEPYRWNFLLENNEDRDDYSRFIELCKAMSSGGTSFAQRMEDVLDIDEATRMYAIHSLCGISDTYWFAANFHNVMFYELSTERRFVVLGWDNDVAFTRGTNSALWGGPNLARLYSIPQYERLFYAHLKDVTDEFFNVSYMRRWTDHYGELAQEAGSFNTVLSYVSARSNFARSAIPPEVPFAITTNSGNDFDTDEPTTTIEGTGWVNIRTILLADFEKSPEISWFRRDRWRVSVPLAFGENQLRFFAFDFNGDLTASDTIAVTSTAGPQPGEFIRGDANRDLRLDVSDVVTTLLFLFHSLELPCPDAADVNDDENLNITDPIFTLEALFRRGEMPPAPFPGPGTDETGDGSLDCP